MPPALARLVRVAGICPQPLRDWCVSQAYASSPRLIGACRGIFPQPSYSPSRSTNGMKRAPLVDLSV
eukprot:1179878-Prorocentrum_minimum.AAC.2